MTQANLNDMSAISITKNKTSFQILIPIRRKTVSGSNEYSFFLKQRNGRKQISLKSNTHMLTNKYVIFKVTVIPPPSLLLKAEKQIWDLYFHTNLQGEELKFRIKTTDNELNLFTILKHNNTRMFYPFRTRHSNLSFVLSYPNVLAAITNVTITKRNICLEGYFHFPPLTKSSNNKLIKAQLVVTNNQNNEDVQIPLMNIRRRATAPSIIEFSCNINLHKRCSKNEKTAFKFFLELDIEKNGQTETLRSERLRWNQQNRELKLKKQFSYTTIGKIKINAQPTKKAKYLSLTVSTYDFKSGLIKETKRKLVKIRRSKWVLHVYQRVFSLIGFLPKKNMIMFESFHGKQFSCSPRALYEYIKENDMNYKMYWSVSRKHSHKFTDLDVNTVQRFTLKWLFLMPRAKYWITNSRLPLWLPKPKRTAYVQTWHGTPLKKLAADMEEVHMPATNAEKYIENFLKEAKKWDYLISPNPYSTEIFRRAFGYEKQIIESGYPRNDFLIKNNREEIIDDIKRKLSLPLNKKIILYAPTWRDNHYYAKGKYKFDIQLDLNQLKSELSDDYIILLRLHYLIADELDLSGYEDFVFDHSHYSDIRELYLVSDLLITDYSSVFFDYANLKRPMIFFVYDLNDYRDKLRGFYFDFEKNAPGPLVKTTEELISKIKKVNLDDYAKTYEMEAFYEKFCSLEDGSACKRVINSIFKKNI